MNFVVLVVVVVVYLGAGGEATTPRDANSIPILPKAALGAGSR